MKFKVIVRTRKTGVIHKLFVNSTNEVDKKIYLILGVIPIDEPNVNIPLDKSDHSERRLYSREEEKRCFELYTKGYNDADLRSLGHELNRTFDSIKMKMQNIRSIITNESKGLNHVSSKTMDTILKYKHGVTNDFR